MTRNEFFGLIGCAMMPKTRACDLPLMVDFSQVNSPGFKVGTRILLDGKDISDDCYRAEVNSDGSGRAFCFRRNADGKFYTWTSPQGVRDVAREIREGAVKIIRPC